eukprot:SM000131S26758  [mRNA]  locus=s131:324889:327208:- [translate_table: standard]
MFQGFNWDSHWCGRWYDVLAATAADLGAAGITDVWLPPPSHSVSPQGYLPAQLYNLDASHYGSERSLRALVDAMHVAGVRVLADIVINHRSATQTDERGVWAAFKGGHPDGKADWGAWALTRDDPYGDGSGNPDSGASCPFAPDLDHTNPVVQLDITEWLNFLRHEIGYDGWRFDFVKGYAPLFTQMYCEATKPDFAVGELWPPMEYGNCGCFMYVQDRNRQELINWVNSTGGACHAFDFTTKGILNVAMNGELWRLKDRENHAPGMIGWYPEKAITFIDNHDTGSSQKHWPFPADKVMAGYAYILTHPGVPCVFYDHFYDWGLLQQITDLIQLRKRTGIQADSKLSILQATDHLYLAEINERVIVKIGPQMDLGHLLPAHEDWRVACCGHDYCVWEKILVPTELEIVGGHGSQASGLPFNITTGSTLQQPDIQMGMFDGIGGMSDIVAAGGKAAKTLIA